MRKVALVPILALSILWAGCGSSSSSTAVSSNTSIWQASLLQATGAPTAFDFITTLSISGSGGLSVSNLTFITSDPCFVSGATANGTASFTVDTTTNAVTGTLTYNVQSGTPSGSALQLTGTVVGTESGGALSSGATVTGTWTLTGAAGCTDGGSFTMKKQ